MSIRLGVVGSRGMSPVPVLRYLYDRNDDIECIVSGGARGADRTAEEWAMVRGVTVVSFRPVEYHDGWGIVRRTFMRGQLDGEAHLPGQYRSFGAAAFVRNGFIVEFADEVVAFWDGKSKGTADSIRRARECGNLRDIVRA